MRERQADTIGASRMGKTADVPELNYKRGLIVSFLAGLLMALVGAFRSDALPFGPRLIYWLIIMMTGALIGIGASTGVRHWGRLAGAPLLEGALISALIAVPLTAVAMGTTLAFFGGSAPPLSRIVVLFAMVLAITGAIIATIYAVARSRLPSRTTSSDSSLESPPDTSLVRAARERDAEVEKGRFEPSSDGAAAAAHGPPSTNDKPVAPPARARLLDRLPRRLQGAELHAIQAEDHYLRVYTSEGSDLILLRMADALSELDGVSGARTHRSWWVARSAIDSVWRGNGRAELTLKGDIVAPVSRSYLPLLQQEGWFS